MKIKEFISYLIENKGFVVIDGKVHRCCYVSGDNQRETFPYHVEDIGFKWLRYNDKPITDEQLKLVLIGLDIKLRKPAEQAYILSRKTP